MDEFVTNHIKGVIESILFVSEKPVTIEQFKEVVPEADAKSIKSSIKEIRTEYDENKRGMTIVELAGGYQMLSSSHYANAIRTFYKKRHKEKLSHPALETLAIIAYKQPVSRADIESIRGVNSDGVTAHLLNKGLIKIVGRKEVPGRPYLFGTTKEFLEYFGLKILSDLPKLEDFPMLEQNKESAPQVVAQSEVQTETQAEAVPEDGSHVAEPQESHEEEVKSVVNDDESSESQEVYVSEEEPDLEKTMELVEEDASLSQETSGLSRMNEVKEMVSSQDNQGDSVEEVPEEVAVDNNEKKDDL